MVSINMNKQARIIELEKQLAVAKAKAEQLDIRAKTMRRESQVALNQAEELRRRIEFGEQELAAVKLAPADEWEAAQQKFLALWDDVHQRLDEVASSVHKALNN